MPTTGDLFLSQITNSVLGGPSLDVALAQVAGIDLARLSAEYDAFINSDIITRGPSEFRSANDTLTVGQGGVVIELVAADGDGAALLAELEALGMQYGGAFKNAVSGLFPIANLDQLPALNNLAFAHASYMTSRVGSVDNQADVAMNTDDVRMNFGVDGTGITVGILSDSFDTSSSASTDYADDIASGDLPAGINILQDFTAGQGIDEGRAMAQLIHDVAPGAALEFASAFFGPAAFAQSIQDLAVNSDVIVDDIGYLTQPFFQDGVIAQAVDTVFAGGDAYFSSAGNTARQSYESDFRETATSDLFGYMGQWHDFDPGAGGDLLQDFTLGNGQDLRLSVQWDDPYISGAPGSGGALTDINVLIFDTDTNALVAGGTNSNIGGDPFEFFAYTNTTGSTQNLAVAIDRFAGPTPNVIKYIDFNSGAIAGAEFFTNSGTSFGHPSAEGGLGVGAAFYQETPEFGQTPPLLENFSSLGDTPIFFDAAGTRLVTPEIRERLDITAPDGTDTTFFGSNRDATPFPNFTGTSAAAPHAAAVAALMLEGDNTLTPTGIYDALQDSAIDILNTSGGIATGVGYDNWSGHGLIDAPSAFAEAGITPNLLVVDILTDEDDGDTSAGDLSLREAIGIAETTNQNIVFDAGLAGGTIRLDAALGTISISSGDFEINGDVDNDPDDTPDIVITGDTGGNDTSVTDVMGNIVTDAITNTNTSDNVKVFDVSGAATNVTFESIVITGGASAIDGGGISVGGSATINVDHSIVSGNVAEQLGGGIEVFEGNLNVTNSTLSGNRAERGGGIFSNTDLSTFSTTISNSTISGNLATNFGGGVNNEDGNTFISNSTITNNSADDGAGGTTNASGVFSFSDASTLTTVTSTIIAGNMGAPNAEGTSFTTGGNNLIGDQTGGGFTDGSNDDQVGTSGALLDPTLGALANNGGATPTHLPQTGSLALDAGANPNSLSTDQRGELRTSGTQTDVGSVEVEAIPDLIVENLMLNSTAFIQGEAITADWVSRNVGTGATPNVFDTGLYISTNSVITTADTLINFLNTDNVTAPGDSEAQTLNDTLDPGIAPGTYFIGAIVDDFGEVTESDEGNNVSNVIEVTISAAPAVTVTTPGGLVVGTGATISEVIPSVFPNDIITVDANFYTANPETVLLDAENVTLNLPAGVTPTINLLNALGILQVTVVGPGAAELVGNDNDNILTGGSGDNILRGGIGADTLNGGAGDDLADYTDSTARVEIDLTMDTADGGTAIGDELNDIEDVVGSNLNDLIVGNSLENALTGNGGIDNINGRSGDDNIVGGAGNDKLSGGSDDDTISGGEDDDEIRGNGGEDSITGGQGLDTVFGGTGADTISTGTENDSVLGQGGADEIIGGGGDDILRGGSGNDSILGGADNDSLFGNGNNDTIDGGSGNDSIQGNFGGDNLIGNIGDDTLSGGDGADTLDGGSGNDVLNGGLLDGARDTFVFMVGYDEDRINSFDQAGTDVLQLDQNLWTGALTEQQVIDQFGSMNTNNTILTLDFGGTDILEVQSAAGINIATFGQDVDFI